jgi:hypothetical protein
VIREQKRLLSLEKRLNTISQFIEHLAVDVVPAFFDEEFGLREPGME